MKESIQEEFAPHNTCFGCGPSNPLGLRIRSFPEGDELVARWTPQSHHEAFPGMLNGGIAGALLDCHANWTAAWKLMKDRGVDSPPCTVTAEFTIRLRRPTPTDVELELRARVVRVEDPKVWVEGEILVNDGITAKVSGLFVAVEEGHPAFHRW